MEKRTYSPYASPNAKRALAKLHTTEEPKDFQDIMIDLGSQLGEIIAQLIKEQKFQGNICLACSVEDADYLAAGALSALSKLDNKNKVRLACFWNQSTIEPYNFEEFEFAPILKSYKEPLDDVPCIIVIIKSIISGACVVATNINNLISSLEPETIFVSAPVMLNGAQQRLQEHFDTELIKKFKYITFATDFQKNEEGHVFPGIGGNVYELYGFGNAKKKNLYVPKLVSERRRTELANPTR